MHALTRYSSSRGLRVAFTLVELLVVLIVISVLLGFTTVRITEAITTAKHTQTKALARQAWLNASSYYTDNAESYANTADLRAYLTTQDMTAGALATDTSEPDAGDLGVIVYDGGESLYVAAKSEDGEIVAWYRNVQGTITSGSGNSAPPPAAAPLLIMDGWQSLIDHGADLQSPPTQIFGPASSAMYFTTISSDGSKVLVQADAGAGWTYYVHDFDTDTASRVIAPGVNWWEAGMSQDGSTVYYWATNAGNTSTDLWSVNSDGTGATQLTTIGSTSSPRDLTVSPDGSKVAYWLGNDIWVRNSDGSAPAKVMTLASQNSELVWAGDATNNWIYFYGNGNMSRVDPDVPEVLQVVLAGYRDGMTVTLDASRIAWRQGGWPNYALWSAEGDGSNPVLVGACPSADETMDMASMSLDGSEVVMSCNGAAYEAYLLASDGSDAASIGAGTALAAGSSYAFWGSVPIANPLY